MNSKTEFKDLLNAAAAAGAITPAIIDYLGTGVNVFAKDPIAGLGLSIFDFQKAGTKVVEIDGVSVEIPTIVNLLPNTSIAHTSGSKTSMDEVSNELNASMGIKGNAGLFSGGIKANFKTSNQGTAYAFYSYVYESISYAEMIMNTTDSTYFTDDFAADLNALPDTFSQGNYAQFAAFFEKWGLYYLNNSGLGGELDTTNAVETTTNSSTASAQVDISAQYSGLYYSGEFDSSVTGSQSWSSFSEDSQTQVYIAGGSLVAQGAVLAIDPLNPSEQSVNAHTEWLKSLAQTPAPTQLRFQPIANLAGEKKEAMDQAAHYYITSILFASDLQGSALDGYEGATAAYVNGVYQPPTSLENPGYQVLVLNRDNPDEVIDNRMFTYDINNWENTYEQMYTDMYDFLQPFGNDRIIVFNSNKVYGGAFPTADMQNYFSNVIGCSKSLQQWADSAGFRGSNNGMYEVLYYGVGIPNNGFESGSGYWLGLSFCAVYRILNVASLVLNSNGKTEILSATQPEFA